MLLFSLTPPPYLSVYFTLECNFLVKKKPAQIIHVHLFIASECDSSFAVVYLQNDFTRRMHRWFVYLLIN